MTGPFQMFGTAISPWVSFADPPKTEHRDNYTETLAGMARELEGIEQRLEHIHDPGPQRPFDQLMYRQARNELEEYANVVRKQIAEHTKPKRSRRDPGRTA